MATQSYEQLVAGASKIKQNELPESNTATLVGEQLLQMVNKQQEENLQRVKGITEYNVSVQHPTSGTDGTNKYSLETAIALVPKELRNVGLKVTFVNSEGTVETWEFQGGTFTGVGRWVNQVRMTDVLELDNKLKTYQYTTKESGFIYNESLIASSGTALNSTSHSTTDFIELDSGELRFMAFNSNSFNRFLAFYSSVNPQATFINTPFGITNTSEEEIILTRENIPEGARFVRISSLNNKKHYAIKQYNRIQDVEKKIKDIDANSLGINEIADGWIDVTPEFNKGYILRNPAIGDIVGYNILNEAQYYYALVDVNAGEKYRVTGTDRNNTNMLTLISEHDVIIDSFNVGGNTQGFDLDIPVSCAKLLLQVYGDYQSSSMLRASKEKLAKYAEAKANAVRYSHNKRIKVNGNGLFNIIYQGGTFSGVSQENSHSRCVKIDCSPGDTFSVLLKTSDYSFKFYAFTDKNGLVLDCFPKIRNPLRDRTYDFKGIIIAPEQSTTLYINNLTGYDCGYVYRLINNPSPIVLRNSDAIMAICAAKKEFRKLPGFNKLYTTSTLFSIAHVSDIHTDIVRWRNFIDFLDITGLIDAAIHTGDNIVGLKKEDVEQEFKEIMSIPGNQEIMYVVGNHEKVGQLTMSNTNKEIYDMYGKFGFRTNTGKLYYYKDYEQGIGHNSTGFTSAYKIRIIVLNQYDIDSDTASVAGNPHFSQEQIDWLINTLRDSAENGYAVMIAMHVNDKFSPTANDFGFFQSCTYSDREYTVVSGSVIEDIVNAFKKGTKLNSPYTYTDANYTITALADFSSKSGTFIAYMAGHKHMDMIGYSKVYPDQLYLIVTTGCCYTSSTTNYGEEASDLPRIVGTKSEDCFNVYGIDLNYKTIRVVRVGADITGEMKERKFAIYSFA